MITRSKRRAVEHFVVAKRGTTLYGTANNHINDSNGNVILADGQLGFFGAKGAYLNKSITAATGLSQVLSPSIVIYQGTANTPMTAPLVNRPYEKTAIINGNNPIVATKQPYKKGSYSTWAIKSITPKPLTTFGLSIAFRGRSIQEMYSSQEALTLDSTYITPSFDTTNGTAVTTAKTGIINALVYDILRNSAGLSLSQRNRGGSFPLIAFAIDTTAATGVVLSTVAANTAIPVASTVAGTRSIKLNADQVASLTDAITAASIPDTATIVPVSLSTPVLADSIIIMAMDRNPAHKDYDVLDKIRLEVGLSYGFDVASTYNKEVAFSREPQNSGKQLAKEYAFTQGQRKYNLMTIEDPIVNYPNPFELDETYDVIRIVHEFTEQIDLHTNATSPLMSIVAIPTATKGVEGVSSLFTAFETALNAWLTTSDEVIVSDNI